ncbi:MAG: FtsX-like permease family protein [Burkholderiaceae bacterium]
MSKTLSLIFRFAARDWRGGELGLLLAALIIAVSSIAAVGFFVDRLRVALESQAAELLGADLIVRSSRELPASYAQEAQRRGLKIARTVEFPSMVSAGALPRLASVKAFDPGYPLRGRPRVFVQGSAGETVAAPLPVAGEAWADPQLVNSLDARNGDALSLGESTFRLTAQIALEPDRGGGFVNFAPRILVPLQDLAATGLVQPGSRVSHRLMVAGDDRAQIDGYASWLRSRLGTAERLETVDDGRPELRTTLDRAEQFLSLVALLSALIAAVAVALAARRFAVRHLDTCAVVKALGMTQGELLRVLVGELLLLALVGGLVGALIGYGVHFLLAQAIAPLMAIALPAPSAWPALQAVLASLILLVGFGAWPFVRLADVSPLRVLRRDIQGAPAQAWVGLVLAALSFAALLFWLGSDRRLAAYALGGFAIGMLVFALLGWALVLAVGRLRHWRGLARRPVLRMALASWSRRRGTAVAQTVALSVGLMALVLLSVTRTDLIDGWQRATPADAPNRFLVNIQPDQQDRVREVLGGHGVSEVPLYPMIRGRLVQINDRLAADVVSEAGQEMAQRSLERELNLSYLTALPGHNQLVSGRWLDPQAAEVSVEEGLARSFGLSLGDLLTFDIAGESVSAKVTSLRKVSWDSMKVNFS